MSEGENKAVSFVCVCGWVWGGSVDGEADGEMSRPDVQGETLLLILAKFHRQLSVSF